MHYQHLFREWRKYPKVYDISYWDSLNSGIWEDPSTDIEDKVQFLCDWLCRTDKKEVIPQLYDRRKSFYELVERSRSLDLIRFDHSNMAVIQSSYNVLSEVVGLGPTAISKYLHMHNPGLFIMWDNQIFRDYFHIKTVSKLTATSKRYLKFLFLMKKEAIEAISTFNLHTIKIEEKSIDELQRSFNFEPIPRILDKYNYVTRGISK